MHIPDGYIGPIMSLGSALVTVPVWSIAVKRVQKILSNRTVPLMAIFAAFSFTIMMFNVPVPGGTTAHGVGGTLAAVVLGPCSRHCHSQHGPDHSGSLFRRRRHPRHFHQLSQHGDNLASGWLRCIQADSGQSPILSTRRVWAAGIGAYVGITASALAVGIELGLQPLLFSDAGRPLYSPMVWHEAIPAMLISHVFGASAVEAIITSLGVAYMQKRYPEYLTSLRAVFAGLGWLRETGGPPDVADTGDGGGGTGRMPVGTGPDQRWWRLRTSVRCRLVAGQLGRCGQYAARRAGIAIVLIPLTYFLLPKRFKGVGTAFMAAAIIAPLGLIAPGFAYGEGSTEDVQAAFGYIPKGLHDLSTIFSAPFSGYN